MNYKIYPLYCCDGSIIKSKLFYQGAPAEEVCPMQYSCFLLESEDKEYMLIDSGYPFKKHIIDGGYEDIYPIRNNAVNSAEDLLAPYGVKPEEITKIFLTHLHYDHAWNLADYPNAAIYVQAAELHSAVTPPTMENERTRAYAINKRVLKDSWLLQLDRIVPIHSEGEIIPGISCLLTRGHTMGSQTIVVDTAKGRYAFPGDYAPSLDSIHQKIPTGMNVNIVAWLEDFPKVQKLLDEGVHFLSNHDPRTFHEKIYG